MLVDVPLCFCYVFKPFFPLPQIKKDTISTEGLVWCHVVVGPREDGALVLIRKIKSEARGRRTHKFDFF